VGCCKTPKYTFSAIFVGLVDTNCQKSGFKLKKRNPCFYPRGPFTKKTLSFLDRYCKGKVFTNIFCAETVFPTCLVQAL